MENTFNLRMIETSTPLSIPEQAAFRKQFESLLKLDGIISLCLESESLYIEFCSKHFNPESFNSALKATGFPMKHKLNIDASSMATL